MPQLRVQGLSLTAACVSTRCGGITRAETPDSCGKATPRWTNVPASGLLKEGVASTPLQCFSTATLNLT